MRRSIVAGLLVLAACAIAAYGSRLGWFDTPSNTTAPAPAAHARIVFKSDQIYPGSANRDQTYELFAPSDYLSKSYPILIWIHGGGWAIGDKSNWPSRVAGRQAATLGFVVFNINYTLNTPEHPAVFPAASDDVRAFVEFLSTNLQLANARASTPVSIGGQSAGGQLALYEASSPDSKIRYRCVLDVSGVTDLTATDLPEVLIPFVQGFAPTRNMQSLASPINRTASWHADRVLFLHARDDPVVPIQQAITMHQSLAKLKAPPQITENFPKLGGHDLTPAVIEDALGKYLPENCS
jgi:acetyl esterase/lipase